jgi:iron complex transport system permease protein
VLIGSGALPVGVVTSFMGAPMFLFLLVRGRH